MRLANGDPISYQKNHNTSPRKRIAKSSRNHISSKKGNIERFGFALCTSVYSASLHKGTAHAFSGVESFAKFCNQDIKNSHVFSLLDDLAHFAKST